MNLDFTIQPQRYAVARLASGTPIPQWATSGAFFSVTQSADELSVICEEDRVPSDCTASRGWRALALRGPFAFTEIGIAAEFTSILAKSGVSVLVVSTYDTDWLFVSGAQLGTATAALRAAGHRVSP